MGKPEVGRYGGGGDEMGEVAGRAASEGRCNRSPDTAEPDNDEYRGGGGGYSTSTVVV